MTSKGRTRSNDRTEARFPPPLIAKAATAEGDVNWRDLPAIPDRSGASAQTSI
jgi:hypothetical protein